MVLPFVLKMNTTFKIVFHNIGACKVVFFVILGGKMINIIIVISYKLCMSIVFKLRSDAYI